MFLWLLAIGRDLWCVVRMLFFNLAGRITFAEAIILNADSPLPPIVLVHGSSGNQSEWMDALPFLTATFKGHPVYGFSLDLPYNPKTGRQVIEKWWQNNSIWMKWWLARQHDWTIEQYAMELGKRIHDAKLKTPVILMGHSMNGLICAQYELTNPQNVHCVIAFGSPFRGSPLLNYRLVKWCGNNSKRHGQMTPRSDFLASLHPLVQAVGVDRTEHSTIDDRMRRYLTVGSPHDWQVPNYFSMIHTVQHITIQGWGHFSIVKSPDVWRQVYAWFQSL